MNNQTFTYLPETDGSLVIKPGATNLYISMPCPMKVPFKQLITPFIEEYNRQHATRPLYCPDVMDCSLEELGLTVQNTTVPELLPDLIIAANYEFFFEYPFYERFLKTGIFTGITNPSDLRAMPEAIRNNLSGNNLGALCFGSRSLVQDLTVDDVPDNIRSWKQLLTPEWEDRLTVHGHLDKATFGFMYFLNEHFGTDGIVRYAKNIADIKHFSQIIKRMGNPGEYRTPVNILPDVATAKIPSTKKIKILDMEEGKMLSPMILVVKTSKMEQCRGILDFFRSTPFRTMLASGCHLPDTLIKNKPCSMPDFSILATGYKRMEKEFNDLFLANVNFEKIKLRETPGGICR